MHPATRTVLPAIVPFLQLLSLGFATIGVRATLIAIAGQVFGIAPDSKALTARRLRAIA
jgi:hypothetical protein